MEVCVRVCDGPSIYERPCLQKRQESVVWSSSAVCDTQQLLETPDPNKDMGPTHWCPWCQRPEDEALSRNWCLEKPQPPPPEDRLLGHVPLQGCDVLHRDRGGCLHSETGAFQHLHHLNVSSPLNENTEKQRKQQWSKKSESLTANSSNRPRAPFTEVVLSLEPQNQRSFYFFGKFNSYFMAKKKKSGCNVNKFMRKHFICPFIFFSRTEVIFAPDRSKRSDGGTFMGHLLTYLNTDH